MKKYGFLFGLTLLLSVLSTGLFSFSENRGGDVFAIYLNGKQIHHQVVHADSRVKTLQLQSVGDNDKIELYYSHCGKIGTSRVVTLRNEQQQVVKRMRFADAKGNAARIGFYQKDIGKALPGKLNLYYSSNELPDGKLLAAIQLQEEKVIAKR